MDLNVLFVLVRVKLVSVNSVLIKVEICYIVKLKDGVNVKLFKIKV